MIYCTTNMQQVYDGSSKSTDLVGDFRLQIRNAIFLWKTKNGNRTIEKCSTTNGWEIFTEVTNINKEKGSIVVT